MIYCQGCGQSHMNCNRLAQSEKKLCTVLGLGATEKEYFCNPLCYLQYRQGAVKMKWKEVEDWFVQRHMRMSEIYKHFKTYKIIMQLSDDLTLDEARAGLTIPVPAIENDTDELISV